MTLEGTVLEDPPAAPARLATPPAAESSTGRRGLQIDFDHNRGVPPRQDCYAGGHSGSARGTSRARLPEEPVAVIE